MRLVALVAGGALLSCASTTQPANQPSARPTYHRTWTINNVEYLSSDIIVVRQGAHALRAFSTLDVKTPLWEVDVQPQCTVPERPGPVKKYPDIEEGYDPNDHRLHFLILKEGRAVRCEPLDQSDQTVLLSLCNRNFAVNLASGQAQGFWKNQQVAVPILSRGVQVLPNLDTVILQAGDERIVVAKAFLHNDWLYALREIDGKTHFERAFVLNGKLVLEPQIVAGPEFIEAEVGRIDDQFVLLLPTKYVMSSGSEVPIEPALSGDVKITRAGVVAHVPGRMDWLATDLLAGAYGLEPVRPAGWCGEPFSAELLQKAQ